MSSSHTPSPCLPPSCCGVCLVVCHLDSDPRAGGTVGATEGWEARRTNPGARPGAPGPGERQHVSLVHTQKRGSKARLPGEPGERAWWPGTSPLSLAGAPCLNFPLCKAEMMIVPAAQGSLLYLQQRGRLCHQADAISLVWPVSAGHGALRGGSCPQGVGSPSSSPHYPQGPPLFPTNCHSLCPLNLAPVPHTLRP